ncbi:hypothetical protein AVEN_11182-1 [Araneus ventricosus]|uniref:Secreted protein n=1 Tax=Araneus ventricosus TaxID=182803 RepID=A0A4Y2TFN7_ARAVE|nr:hypothetical protein AVEN_11182-1 [Araneus ventricosus]
MSWFLMFGSLSLWLCPVLFLVTAASLREASGCSHMVSSPTSGKRLWLSRASADRGTELEVGAFRQSHGAVRGPDLSDSGRPPLP